MNLAVFIRSFYTGTGGAEKQALLLLRCLSGDHRMCLIVFKGDRIDEKYARMIPSMGIRYYYLEGNLASRLYKLFRILRKDRIDVILSYLAINNFWGGIIGRLAGVKTIIGGIRSSKYSWRKLILQKLIHNYLSDLTIFNNYRGYHELIHSGFRKDKALVIPNGIKMDQAYHRRLPGHCTTIITVARFVPLKDHHVAIKTIRHLLDHFAVNPEEIRYQLIGYGPLEKEMKVWINQYQLEKSVELVIRPSNLDDYYKNADIYLCASTFEGISNSVLEALSFGLPLIATDVGDNRNLVLEGESGFIVPVGNYDAMAGCLHQLIRSPEKRLEFGEKGYHLCRERYSSETFRQAYLTFLDSLEKKERHA